MGDPIDVVVARVRNVPEGIIVSPAGHACQWVRRDDALALCDAAADAERLRGELELWQTYAGLLLEECSSASVMAGAHGWRSTRAGEAEELLAALPGAVAQAKSLLRLWRMGELARLRAEREGV